MEKLFLVALVFCGLVLSGLAYQTLRSDQSYSRKYARVRVRADDNRRRQWTEPQEDEFEPLSLLEWIAGGAMFLVIIYLLSKL